MKIPLCGPEGWMISSVMSLTALVLASAGLGALIAVVASRTDPEDRIRNVTVFECDWNSTEVSKEWSSEVTDDAMTTTTSTTSTTTAAVTLTAPAIETSSTPIAVTNPAPTDTPSDTATTTTTIHDTNTTPMTCHGDATTNIECTQCTECYACLSNYSGQDAVGICEGGSLSISEQCREQVLFLYQHENVNNDIPCYAQCRSCRDCLLTSNNDTHLGELNSTLWETVYASYFADIPSNDTVDDDDSSEESSTSSNGSSSSVSRKKRQIPDGDACCQTQRQTLPYLAEYRDPYDPFGAIWYPVWFSRSYASPPTLYQLYDHVTCPTLTAPCGNPPVLCRLQMATRSMLMSRDRPHIETGYSYIFLHYPSTRVRFIEIPLPCYCRCTN